MGGKVPSSYYLSNNLPVAKDYMETMSVGAGGKKKLKYDVNVPFSVLRYTLSFWVRIVLILIFAVIYRWEFMTEGGDIKYRVYNKNVDTTNYDLVPLSQVDSHLVMEEGEIIIYEPGQCKCD